MGKENLMAALAHAMVPPGQHRAHRHAPLRRHLSDWNILFRAPAAVTAGDITEVESNEWLASVQEQFEHVANLPIGWDSAGSGPVRRDVLDYALALLEAVMRHDSPPPHVTPMSHEGVMLEWHTDRLSLEIEIKEPGTAYMTFENRATGEEKELRLVADFRELAKYLMRSTQRAS